MANSFLERMKQPISYDKENEILAQKSKITPILQQLSKDNKDQFSTDNEQYSNNNDSFSNENESLPTEELPPEEQSNESLSNEELSIDENQAQEQTPIEEKKDALVVTNTRLIRVSLNTYIKIQELKYKLLVNGRNKLFINHIIEQAINNELKRLEENETGEKRNFKEKGGEY